jgi:hypothetical protein
MTATRTSSRPSLCVESARDLGPQFIDNPHRMVGQDGAFSIPLGPTRRNETLWFFGDTLVGTRPRDHSIWLIDGQLVGPGDMTGRGTFDQMVNNTGLLLPKQTGARGLRDYRYLLDERGKLKNLLPLDRARGEHPDVDRIWCQHGLRLGDDVFLSFIQVRMLDEPMPPLPLAFEIVASGLARGRVGEWNFERIVRDDGDHLLWNANDPHFATAFVLDDRRGMVYCYGTVSRGGIQKCYVARVEAEHFGQPTAWEYLSSTTPTWTPDVANAIAVFDRMPSECSVSFNAYVDCYLAVHSLELSGQIVGRTAREPWGPWSEPTTLWTVTPPSLPYERPYELPLIYAGKEHPELAADNGRMIYLTYIEFEEYYPHLVEVTLS